MKYSIGYRNPATQFIYIQIDVLFAHDVPRRLQLPVWRPGRYERGDFAQYLTDFSVTDMEGNSLEWKKINPSLWEIHSDEAQIRVSYRFYAGLLNAGSTWLDAGQLYVNPVNCLMYVPGQEDMPCTLKLDIPEPYTVASSLKETAKNTYAVDSYHTLADSPFIASNALKQHSFECDGVLFTFWFSGECKPVWKRIQFDTEAIIRSQFQTMGRLPVNEYHILCHVLPHHAYHGVEHTASTVFTLGPSYEFMEPSLYNEFLGIFSHELFHVWNVKTIRPADMFPYDYSRENYSELGYVYEGVTTYYGDLFCLRSGTYSWDTFSDILNDWISKHYHNYGRKSYSVAQSSFDTWLDGYKPGIPHRRVNIYNEGALCALMADLMIRRDSYGQYSLDHVMQTLNEEFGNCRKGYTRNDYKRVLEQYAGGPMDEYFNSFVEGKDDYGKALIPLLEHVGLALYTKENISRAARHYGFKLKNEGERQLVAAIAPGSPAENAGIMLNDEIRAVNGRRISNDLDHWLNYFADEDRIELTLANQAGMRRIFLMRLNRTFYPTYVVLKKESTSTQQRAAFEKWSGSRF